MTLGEPLTFGMDRDRPLCEGSPWYIGQSGGAAAVPLADAAEDGAAAEVAAAGGVEDGAGLADPEQPGRRQGEQDDQRPGTQADSETASSMLHIASIPPIEGALPLVIGWSRLPARLPLAFVCDFGCYGWS